MKKSIIMSLLLATSLANAAVNLEWYNIDNPVGSFNFVPALDRFGNVVISDPVGNLEMSGALFQLIKAAGPVATAPNAAGLGTTPATAGGDTMVWYNWANEGAVGDGLIYSSQSLAALNTTDFIYIRIWESPTTGAGNAPLNGWYWDSAIVQINTLPDVGGVVTWAFAPSTASGWQLVPEPSVLAFMGIGAMLMAIRRRRA